MYRIGRTLDVTLSVNGEWSAWIDVPHWFLWDNRDVSVAITPPDGGGKRDLVIFTIENAPQLNRGLVIKSNANQAYATDAAGGTRWAQCWRSFASGPECCRCLGQPRRLACSCACQGSPESNSASGARRPFESTALACSGTFGRLKSNEATCTR